jgi:tyrosyl-tRNA synthetase
MDSFTAAQIVQLCGHYTVARMLERDDFSSRFRDGRPIGIHEFLYPLVQGYDSVALTADVEVGGTDQRFNLLVGREIQKAYGQRPQVVLTLPLLEGTDGVQKMSKSLGNAIGIAESPDDIFGKIMSLSDALMVRYYELLTDENVNSLRQQMTSGALHPMDAKKRLATKVVARYWGPESAIAAESRFASRFQRREPPRDAPVFEWPDAGSNELSVAALIVHCKMAQSTSQARRLIGQSAVRLDGVRVSSITSAVSRGAGDESVLLQVGTRRAAVLRGARKVSP